MHSQPIYFSVRPRSPSSLFSGDERLKRKAKKKREKDGEERDGFVRSGSFLELAPRRLVARSIIESSSRIDMTCLNAPYFKNYLHSVMYPIHRFNVHEIIDVLF